jgi:hypothetical protein
MKTDGLQQEYYFLRRDGLREVNVPFEPETDILRLHELEISCGALPPQQIVRAEHEAQPPSANGVFEFLDLR